MVAPPPLWLAWLARHGVEPRLAADLVRGSDWFGCTPQVEGRERAWPICGVARPIVEDRSWECGIAADHASLDVAEALARRPAWAEGAVAWDVGCGTGLLGAVAARLGAQRVVVTDVVPQALALAQSTLRREGREAVAYLGRDIEALPPSEPPATLVLANLPHKPGNVCASLPISQAGGVEGEDAHKALANALAARLPAGARVMFFLHSLPAPSLLRAYAAHGDIELLSWKVRWFAPQEYVDLRAGFLRRVAADRSYLVVEGERLGTIAGVFAIHWRDRT